MDVQTCIDEYLELATKIFPLKVLYEGAKSENSSK